MAKWLIAIALAGCASNNPAPSGTYTLTLTGQTCNDNAAQSITFTNGVITVMYTAAYSNPSVTGANAEIDGSDVSFDTQFSATDLTTSDTANGNENFMVSLEDSILSGSVDGMYSGMRGGAPFACSSLLGVDGTRAAN